MRGLNTRNFIRYLGVWCGGKTIILAGDFEPRAPRGGTICALYVNGDTAPVCHKFTSLADFQYIRGWINKVETEEPGAKFITIPGSSIRARLGLAPKFGLEVKSPSNIQYPPSLVALASHYGAQQVAYHQGKKDSEWVLLQYREILIAAEIYWLVEGDDEPPPLLED